MSKQPNSQLFHKPYAPVFLMPGKTGAARSSHATEQGRAFLAAWKADAQEALGSLVGRRFIEGFTNVSGSEPGSTADDTEEGDSHMKKLINGANNQLNRQSALIRDMEAIHLEDEHRKHDTSAVRHMDAIKKGDMSFRILVLLLIALGFAGYYAFMA
jgi:hypothetical protein